MRGKTRRRFSAEERIRIVLEGLRGEESIATLCRREGIVTNLYYRWSKEFLEAGKTSFQHKWVFDLDRGTLLFTGSNVNLAFDSGARRATPIPPRIRDELEAQYHPDLR